MKILKIKIAGLTVYPATITNAVKDPTFTKLVEGQEIPMTLNEINTYLDNKTGGEISLEAKNEIVDELKQFIADNIKCDLSKESHIRIDRPSFIVKCNLIIDLYPDTKDDNYTGEIEFVDAEGHYFKKPISGIGALGSMSYTIHFPKQSFKFDMTDCDIKFGNWPVLDSFHMKAWFIDGLRGKGIVVYRAMSEINDSMGYNKARPWRRMFSSSPFNGSGDEWNDFDTECTAVPDAFPVALYVNGEFYGIFTWSIKKDRTNYHMKKSNENHIHIDSTDSNWESFMFNSSTTNRGKITWNKASIRNPNDLVTTTTALQWTDVTTTLNTTDPDGEGYIDPETMFKIASADAGGLNPSEWTDEYITNVIIPLGFDPETDLYVWYLTSKNKTKYFHKEISNTLYSKDYPSELVNDASIDEFTYNVRLKIQRLSDFYYDYYQVAKVNSSTTDATQMANKKAKFEEYFDPDWMIDYFLTANFIMLTDCMHRNTQWCTWDGVKWYPLMYDTDTAFGSHWCGPYTNNTKDNCIDQRVLGVNGSQGLPWTTLWLLYKEEIYTRYAELVDLGFFTVDYWNEKLTEWVKSIGSDYYKKEFEKWSQTPGYRDPLTNTTYWKWRGNDNKAKDENGEYIKTVSSDGIATYTAATISPYRETTEYHVGDLVYMADDPDVCVTLYCTIFECIQDCVGECPVTGRYEGIVNVERGNWGIGPVGQVSADDLIKLHKHYSSLEYGGYFDSVQRVIDFLTERKKFCDKYFHYQSIEDIIAGANTMKGE